METFTTDFPQRFAIVFDSVWTTNENLDTVTRIDPKTGKVTTIQVTAGVGPQSITAAGDAVWASGGGGIVSINPTTNAVTSRSDTSAPSLRFAFGSVWAGIEGGALRLDPATGETVSEPRTGGEDGCGISDAAGSVWLGCGKNLYRIDPTTNDVIATLEQVGPQPQVVTAEGGTWLMTSLEPFVVSSNDLAYSQLDRLDVSTNRVVPGTSIRLVHGASAPGILADGGNIWFSTSFGDPPGAGMLYKFDSASGNVTRAWDMSEGKGCGSNAIAFAYGSLWSASGICNAVRRFPNIAP